MNGCGREGGGWPGVLWPRSTKVRGTCQQQQLLLLLRLPLWFCFFTFSSFGCCSFYFFGYLIIAHPFNASPFSFSSFSYFSYSQSFPSSFSSSFTVSPIISHLPCLLHPLFSISTCLPLHFTIPSNSSFISSKHPAL